MTTSAELAELAAAHHVATSFRGSDRQMVQVDDEVVVAVLAQLGVDASGPDAIGRELDAVRRRQAETALPPTIVMTAGTTRELDVPATLVLEDGTSTRVERLADVPLGWHRLVTDTQDVTLIVAPARMPEVPRTWGWMLQLYSLGTDRSWGMGDYGDLAEMARRAGTEQGAGVLLVNPVQAFVPSKPLQRSPYSPSSRRYANPLYLRVTETPVFLEADETTRRDVLALRPDPSTDLIDYDEVWAAKLAALELLWATRPAH